MIRLIMWGSYGQDHVDQVDQNPLSDEQKDEQNKACQKINVWGPVSLGQNQVIGSMRSSSDNQNEMIQLRWSEQDDQNKMIQLRWSEQNDQNKIIQLRWSERDDRAQMVQPRWW